MSRLSLKDYDQIKTAVHLYNVCRYIILVLIIHTFTLGNLSYSQQENLFQAPEISGYPGPEAGKIVALDEPIDPKTYRLGPGDRLTIFMWGGIQAQYDLTITPEGKLLFPNIGPIDVSGLYLFEVKSRIEKMVLKRYQNVQVTSDLTGLRHFRVYVTGAVNYPGVYEANSATRVSEVILKAGGFIGEEKGIDSLQRSTTEVKFPQGMASHRNIILTHVNGGIDTVDVLIFEQAGDLRYNFKLTDGDEIFVPLREEEVNLYGIFGGVKDPGYFEYSPRDSLKDLISLAHGLSIDAESSTAELVRFNEDGKTTTKTVIALKDILTGKCPDIHLLPDDRVYIRTIKYYHEKQQILAMGEVKFPGFYAIKPDSTYLTQIIEKAGGFTQLASLTEAEMTRFVSKEVRDREFERLKQMQVGDMSDLEYEYFKVKSREKPGRVSVDFEELFNGRGKGDIKLRDGDIIYIPRMSEVVVVSGEVANPGIISYHSKYNYLDYIKLTGGYSFRADKKKVRIIKGVTGEWKKAKRNTRLDPGDAILVPEKKKIKYFNVIRDVVIFLGNTATVYLVIREATK
jgi:protein involved in polysaccharide export with SLBB domain